MYGEINVRPIQRIQRSRNYLKKYSNLIGLVQ